jgi:hypothetical protein
MQSPDHHALYEKSVFFNLMIVIGDTLPVLLALYFPQYPALADRTFVLLFVSIFLVSLVATLKDYD